MNKNYEEHYHCILCEEPYSTKAEAELCFKNHNETDHLKWVAREVVYMKSYMYDLMKWITFIDEKYKITDWEE